MRRLVLASTSPYRNRLLLRLGIPFEALAPGVDESARPHEAPRDLVARLSRAKAEAVAARCPDALIIGSDQVGVCGGRILTKPGTSDAAHEQLRSVSGCTVIFYTGLCLLDTATGTCQIAVEQCAAHFRCLTDTMIENYVARELPLDCAGSFKVEGLGIALFDRIESEDPTALEGLPLIRLTEFLASTGNPVLAG